MSLIAYAGFDRVPGPKACNQRVFEPGVTQVGDVCSQCGRPIHDHPVKNAKAKICASLRKAGKPLRSGQLAEQVYGEDSLQNRNRVIAHIWHMNRAGISIVSHGRGISAKGYSLRSLG